MDCLICFGEASDTTTACDHSFHKECLGIWLERHSACPYCRTILLNSNSIYDKAVKAIASTNFYPEFQLQYTNSDGKTFSIYSNGINTNDEAFIYSDGIRITLYREYNILHMQYSVIYNWHIVSVYNTLNKNDDLFDCVHISVFGNLFD